jgi:pyruvate/2-oxoglutarate dehydrogenase complex dihydrolipoamide dehydrogenase (E3) component
LGRDREQRFEISTAALVTRAGKSVNNTSHIENVVLGGGEAGKYIAWELAQQGRPVVVIERALIGGSCPNVACLPSKNVIRSAKVADLANRGAAYGIRIESASVEMEGVRRRKRKMVDGLRARALGETRGFMKMLLDASSDRILGFTMLGVDAGEVVAVVQTAMLGGLPYTVLRDAILTHQTMPKA